MKHLHLDVSSYLWNIPYSNTRAVSVRVQANAITLKDVLIIAYKKNLVILRLYSRHVK